jgi:glycosyltransferase involved in cell wall biosynthesis
MSAPLDTESRRKSAAPVRIGIFQRRLAGFRVPVFARLAQQAGVVLSVLVAEEPENSSELPFDCRVLPRRSLPIGGSRLWLQRGFVKEAAQHDVVLLEGSMRFLTSVGLVLTRRLHGAAPVWWTSLYDPKSGTVAFPAGLKGLVLRHLLKRVGAVATYSETAASLLRSKTPFAEVFVAPNVLDTDVLAQAEAEWFADPSRLDRFAAEMGLLDRAIVLFVGRLVRAKRLEDLLHSFELLRRRRPDLDPLLVIVGDGSERARLQRIARSLGISGDVKWFGEIRDARQVCPFFLKAKTFVLPGSGGLAVYQALVHGVPVVATHADGTERDLIRHGETGFLCEPGDVETIARRAETILELERDAWLDLSTACRRLASEELHVRSMIRGLRQAVDAARSVQLGGRMIDAGTRGHPIAQGTAGE